MSKYEELIEQARLEGLTVFDKVQFKSRVNGLIVDKTIAISGDIESERERLCVLAEEIGHHYINTGDILRDPYQENKAHRYAIDLILSVEMVINTIIELKENATIATVARELEVTEEFLKESLDLYSKRFEGVVHYKGYVVTFCPHLHIDQEGLL